MDWYPCMLILLQGVCMALCPLGGAFCGFLFLEMQNDNFRSLHISPFMLLAGFLRLINEIIIIIIIITIIIIDRFCNQAMAQGVRHLWVLEKQTSKSSLIRALGYEGLYFDPCITEVLHNCPCIPVILLTGLKNTKICYGVTVIMVMTGDKPAVIALILTWRHHHQSSVRTARG